MNIFLSTITGNGTWCGANECSVRPPAAQPLSRERGPIDILVCQCAAPRAPCVRLRTSPAAVPCEYVLLIIFMISQLLFSESSCIHKEILATLLTCSSWRSRRCTVQDLSRITWRPLCTAFARRTANAQRSTWSCSARSSWRSVRARGSRIVQLHV